MRQTPGQECVTEVHLLLLLTQIRLLTRDTRQSTAQPSPNCGLGSERSLSSAGYDVVPSVACTPSLGTLSEAVGREYAQT
jgi:hypothetical protein